MAKNSRVIVFGRGQMQRMYNLRGLDSLGTAQIDQRLTHIKLSSVPSMDGLAVRPSTEGNRSLNDGVRANGK